ncbi:MAG: hypothetical protein EZS28_037946, partial [Streblomastix strix]
MSIFEKGPSKSSQLKSHQSTFDYLLSRPRSESNNSRNAVVVTNYSPSESESSIYGIKDDGILLFMCENGGEQDSGMKNPEKRLSSLVKYEICYSK